MPTQIWFQLLFVGFALSTIVACRFLLRCVFGWSLLAERIAVALAIITSTILAADSVNVLNGFEYRTLQPWANFVPVFAVAIFAWASAKSLSLSLLPQRVVRQPLFWMMAVCSVAISYWSWSRLTNYGLIVDYGMIGISPGELVENEEFVGVTDKGEDVTLYRMDVQPEKYQDYAKDSLERVARLTTPVILRADPSSSSNCHGWVFAQGEHFMRGHQIDLILRDNGYQTVKDPQVDDIVIYRSHIGEILHTGLVRGILNDGTILIESKWGADGRFLHRPENQPYSLNFQYYHSNRGTHQLSVRKTENRNVQGAAARLESQLAPVPNPG